MGALGELFSKLFCDGLFALFLAAEALPALPFPVVMDGPDVEPVAAVPPVPLPAVVPAVLVPVADPPAAEPPPAAPPALCARAIVVERVIAANTAHIRFMSLLSLMGMITNTGTEIRSDAEASIRAGSAAQDTAKIEKPGWLKLDERAGT